jgi:hypothetical protein
MSSKWDCEWEVWKFALTLIVSFNRNAETVQRRQGTLADASRGCRLPVMCFPVGVPPIPDQRTRRGVWESVPAGGNAGGGFPIASRVGRETR